MRDWAAWLVAGLVAAGAWWFFYGGEEGTLTTSDGNSGDSISEGVSVDITSAGSGSESGKDDRALAAAGDREAMRRLGNAYRTGDGMAQDDGEAVRWYRLAAEKGDAEAQWRLAECYRDGCGVEKDEAWADIWFRAAAEQGEDGARQAWTPLKAATEIKGIGETEIAECRQLAEGGDPRAQCLMGEWSLAGKVRDMGNGKSGAEWYRMAAETGDAEGQRWWGQCLADGNGVEQDSHAAERWLKEAAYQGNEEAKAFLKKRWSWQWHRDDDDMIALHRDAESGKPEAQRRLGKWYLSDGGMDWSRRCSKEYDSRQAVRWLGVAAKGGDAEAMYCLGLCLADGRGVEADEAAALRLFAAAEKKGWAPAGAERARRIGREGVLREQARQGSHAAQFELGKMLAERGDRDGIALLRKVAESPDGVAAALWLESYYVGRDPTQMVHWCHRAADLGNIEAMHRMVSYDSQHALSWLKKLYEKGGGSGVAVQIGRCYEDGKGCAKNYGEAKRWYRRGGDFGGVARIEALEKRNGPLFGTL